IEPGGAVWVGIRQHIAPGWHTYWINPGDSGEPMTVAWTLPRGVAAGPLVWPHPERIPVGPAMSFGYTDAVVVLARLTAPADLSPGARLDLRARASWLVCAKICIPEEADVALTLPVVAARPAPDPRSAPAIAAARRAVPAPSPWPARYAATPESVTLTVAAPRLRAERVGEVWFFPARWGVIDHAAPQDTTVDPDGIIVRLRRGDLVEAAEGPIDGVLVIRERLDGGIVSQAFVIQATPSEAAAGPAGPAAPIIPAVSLLEAIGLALLGGLILNLMPCVLPVLSVKALALVAHADAGPGGAWRQGLAYTAGVLLAFGTLAGALLTLRAGGDQIGWGFQLQSPAIVTLLAYLFFALALALSGVWLVGGRITGFGQGLTARSGHAGTFFTGALAAVAATPCTAPFMGVAVGYAVTQPAGAALLVFEALGLGLALPYLALSLAPAWRRWLPRPGAWMEWLKQALAFPLYATAAWLVWVLSRQAGPEAVAAALGGLLLIAFAAWLHGRTRDARPRWRRAGSVAAVTGVVAALALSPLASSAPRSAPPAAPATAGGPAAESWSPRRVAELRAQGKPVFVNFTAAWCITCLVNERIALHSPVVAEAFARKGVVYLRADWTSRSAEIAAALGTFGRNGVPLYVVYPAGARVAGTAAAPTVLPQILSERTILEAIEAL
ncbi:MAG TPA: thioredoxin family protein, partial [Pseudomonadales bacterium]|nr:thioredoxin family protein [Pseudomonadales bacterium]